MNTAKRFAGTIQAIIGTMTTSNPTVKKESLYTTARATVSCAAFKAGELVAIRWWFTAPNGTEWFRVVATQRGALAFDVAYPQHHLAGFCL